jgi:hypothetical protein
MQIALTQRPKEYTDAIEALKHSFVKSIEIVQKLNVLGQKYGLSSQEIMKDKVDTKRFEGKPLNVAITINQ